jgi:outer membrane protein, heavy metal efflux system
MAGFLKKFSTAALVVILFMNSGFVYAGQKDSSSLYATIQAAKNDNPQIAAAKKRWDAAKARIPQAKSPDDPQVSASAQMMPKSPLNVGKAPAQEKMLSVSQFLPFFWKLSLQGKIAVIDGQTAGAEYKKTELDIVNEVQKAYFGLYMNYKEEELNQQSLVLLQGLAKTAEARYASSMDTPQADILKIDVEIARLNTAILNIQQERTAKEAALNNLLGRRPENPVGAPESLEENIPAIELYSLYKSTLVNQPELLIFQYAIERNKFEKSLAKRSVFPDITAEITKRGLGLWDIMLSFTVPLWYWTKQKYQIKEAVANLEQAQAAYTAMSNQSLARTKEMYVTTQTAYNKINLYKNNLLPLLEQSINSSLSAFSSGKGDFMELLDSERMLIDTRMEYYRAVVEFNTAVVDLERAAGIGLGEVKI